MDPNISQTLPLLSHKHLPYPIDPTKVAYCDIHDLIAVIPTASSNDVTVYRAVNGQVAFTAKHPDPYEEDVRPCLLSWKPDGSILGVGWEDGSWCLYSGEDGKLVAKLDVGAVVGEEGWRLDLAPEFGAGSGGEEGEERVPGCLGWTAHSWPSRGGGHDSGEERGGNGVEVSTEDWFDGVEDDQHAANGKFDTGGVQQLADSITVLDVTKVLPGLSALPAHGARGGPEAAKFATQSGVDTAFSSSRIASDGIDTLLISEKSGPVSFFLDDSVKIGGLDHDIHDAIHASHSQCASQVLLSQPKGDDVFRLHFVDLPLDILGGSLLHVVALNTKRLQSLITYITQTVRCLQHDFVSGQQLPTRIINGLREELKEKGEADPTTALFELLMTGKFTPVMTEWLMDTVKDTLRSRWEQALVEMYHNIENHIFVHLLPALDRLSIATSALRGQAKLHEGTTVFDVSSQLFNELDDSIDALRLVAIKMQLVATAEFRQFYAFIKWVKVMVDVATLGPGSKTAIETEQKEVPGLDMGLVGTYIRQTMGKSKLATYVEQLANMRGSLEKNEFFAHPTVGKLKRSNVVSALNDQLNCTDMETPEGSSEKVALNLPALTARLVAQARLCLDAITTWQQSMLTKHASSKAIASELPAEPQSRILDLKIFPAGTDESVTQVLVQSKADHDGDELSSFSVRRRHRRSGPPDRSARRFDDANVLHARIYDRRTVFALLEAKATGQYSLVACRLDIDGVGDGSQWSRETLHNFSLDTDRLQFKPRHFVVGGRPGKQVVVVFGGDDRTWQVLDLSSAVTTAGNRGSKTGFGYDEDDDDEMKF